MVPSCAEAKQEPCSQSALGTDSGSFFEGCVVGKLLILLSLHLPFRPLHVLCWCALQHTLSLLSSPPLLLFPSSPSLSVTSILLCSQTALKLSILL